jgi:small-conductance mechanosensitive channel
MEAIRSGVKWLWGAILVVFLAVGIPLAWVWVGSQVQGGTSPTGTAIVTVIVGLTMSYSIVALVAAWLKGRQGGGERYRFLWTRSMRDERYQPTSTTFLENVLIVATIVVALIIVVWFFAFGSPGVPVTP